jgi:ABC-type multidrug transport system fused ATPase/permease subunit
MQKESAKIDFSWWDTIKALYYLLDTKRVAFSFYAITLSLVLLYDLVPSWVIAQVVDFLSQYEKGQSLSTFYWFVLFLSVTWSSISLIRLIVKKRLATIGIESGYFARVKGFERLLDFSIKWHDSENTGNKVQKIQAGSDALKQLQQLLTQQVFGIIVSILGVLGAFLFIAPVFFIISLIYISIFLTIQMSFYRKLERVTYENNILLEKASGSYVEGLNNILTIKTLGVKDDFKKSITNRESIATDNSKQRLTLMNNKWRWFQVINGLTLGIVLWVTGLNFLSGAITLGSIFIVYNYFQKLNKAVMDTTDIIDRAVNIKTSLSRMMPIFWEETATSSGKEKFPASWNSIELVDATFYYPKKETALADVRTLDTGLEKISLSIKKNEKIGIVGRSGSGKSTLAKILLGLYNLESGEYMIGGREFTSIKHEEVTRYMALVLQDSEMFNLSLKENVTLMREWNKHLFDKAVSIAQLEELIAKLPEGTETLIGEKGYRLSGGERQRLGIARAIYRDPQILVLDEATSSLDNKTETAIQHAIDTQLSNKTIITIAHRISTLKNVDRIFVFENGKISEEGTFSGLMADQSSKFYNIYQNTPVEHNK